MGPAPSITRVPMGRAPRTSHRRGPARTPQQSTGSTSCHRTVPHHRSLVRGEEGLAAGHGVPSSLPKWHSSPFQQSACSSVHVGLVSSPKIKGFGRRQGCLRFFTAQLPLWGKAPQEKAFALTKIIWRYMRGRKKNRPGKKKSNSHTHMHS